MTNLAMTNSSVLCTFGGGFGDILWSLPTVRELSKKHNTPVDMMIMPRFTSLLSLLSIQPYINCAFVNENWICTGEPHGCQPWEAPSVGNYAHVYHLTYRRHPTPQEPLVDFIAEQQGITLQEPVVPFIDLTKAYMLPKTPTDNSFLYSLVGCGLYDYVAVAFNAMYSDLKARFSAELQVKIDRTLLVDTSKFSWGVASYVIKNALAFVGCRSSNYVLAHGVGQKNLFIYEPHPNRNATGVYGKTFGNPYWMKLHNSPLGASPEDEAARAAYFISIWKKEKEHAIAQTSAG